MVAQNVILHDVWAGTLDEEFAVLRKVARKASLVVTNIEFPGICMTPIGTFFSQEHFSYQQLLVNVNALKPLQMGFTFLHCGQVHVFQFNFHFNPQEDMICEEALQAYEAAGLDLEKHNVSLWPLTGSFRPLGRGRGPAGLWRAAGHLGHDRLQAGLGQFPRCL